MPPWHPILLWLLYLYCSLFLVAPFTAAKKYYHHVEKETDRYGIFYRNSYGQKMYTFCFDPRFSLGNRCRRPAVSVPQYGHVLTPAYDERNKEQHRYDGRGNVNVGRGRFYQRGVDLLVECEFPRRDSLATDIVWYRKTYGPHDLDDGYSGEYKSSRFRVDSIGGHGSRLIVKDYRATVDNGVYRCFSERYDPDRED